MLRNGWCCITRIDLIFFFFNVVSLVFGAFIFLLFIQIVLVRGKAIQISLRRADSL